MSGDIALESESLRVVVRPHVGGTITMVEHKQLGLSVLGTVPWQPLDTPLEPPAAPDERTWLTRYTGGWPLLFPNGGDACSFDGALHGFHGEASISPWAVETRGSTIRLTRQFTTVPVHMRREISLEDDLLTIRETAEAKGDRPVVVMWGHHPTFGSGLLAKDFEIGTGAGTIRIDEAYDPPPNPFQPGAAGQWPMIAGKGGLIDVRRPLNHAMGGKLASLAYLDDFAEPWISIRRLDDAVAVALSWDADLFPSAWLWFEIEGTTDTPWSGRTRLVGLEPNSTGLAYGLAEARRRGARLLTLQPSVPMKAIVRLHVFKPRGAVQGIDASGRARH